MEIKNGLEFRNMEQTLLQGVLQNVFSEWQPSQKVQKLV